MKKTEANLALLSMFFGLGLVLANVLSAKLIPLGFCLFGMEIKIPGGVFCYAITFLVTDVIGETWGRAQAGQTVRFGLFCQIAASLLILAVSAIPTTDAETQAAVQKILGINWIFTVASLSAYLVSQQLDVFVFHAVRSKWIRRGSKYRFLWNNLGTLTSQAVDTLIYLGIAFGIGQKWFWQWETTLLFFGMAAGQYLVKGLLALLDTPFFYLLTRNKGT